MRMSQIACAAAVTLVLVLASAAPAAAQDAEYSDTHAGLTLEGRFINADGACNGYPMYLPGGSVEAVAVIGNERIRRPLAFTFNVELYELTPEGALGESLGLLRLPDRACWRAGPGPSQLQRADRCGGGRQNA